MAPNEVGRVAYERPPTPPASSETAGEAFEALLYPNRSLPPAGFAIVMGIVICVNLTLGVYFAAIGAWPVLGFCGVDIFLVWLAFKVSYRQGRLHERIRLDAEELVVSRVLPSGHESRWRLQPFWTSVSIVAPKEHHAEVRLTSRGRTLILGSFLSPKERVAFGGTLKEALRRVTSGGD
ncbi:MAG: DUF2244 domain-containing protein [Alphaproteobacteria bacterium]|nr:DUF2244 domain-containing protein [Alphaproteobacteria bacterium]